MAQTKTTTKKTTKKSTGKSREEQSKELFKNISEYANLGFRIGDGLQNMFNTLVTSISKKKAALDHSYTFRVESGVPRTVFGFTMNVGKTKSFPVSIFNGPNCEPSMSIVTKAPTGKFKGDIQYFPMSEQGIKDMLKEIKVIK